MSEERIQRILARAGITSRRKAEELIREARVTVNGKVAEIGDKADPSRDHIKVDNKRIQPHEGPYRYLLLNKPRAVMSTLTDPEGRKTVMDFVPPTLRKALVPVGRLDFDTEGLIVLTDDGDFAQHVAHPRYGGSKTYEVKVKGEPSEALLDKLREGIILDGKRTLPARIVRRTKGVGPRKRRANDEEGHNTWWVVELVQGRTRQIREMFQRIGHPVQKLRRVAIGPVRAPDLALGSLREMSEREVETLRRITSRPKKKQEAGDKPAKKAAPVKSPAAAKKIAAKKAAAKKAAARREGTGTEETGGTARKAAPARKAPAKKAPGGRAAAKPAVKRAGAKSAVKRAGAKSPVKRAGAKKTGPGGGGRTSGAPRSRRS